MKKINILQIGSTYKQGGIESFILNYSENLNKDFFSIDFINTFPEAKKENFYKKMQEYGKVYNTVNYRKHPIKFISEFKKICANKKYDIVHYNMSSSVYLVPLIAAKLAGIKVIISHAHNNKSDKGFLKGFFHFLMKRFIPLFSNAFFACSESAGKWFYSKKIINSNNFYIIKNGIETKKFIFDKNIRKRIRRELGIEDDTIVIGHVGNFKPVKNHKFVIDIYNEINKMADNTKLVLVGQGILLEEIKQKVKKLNLENKVIFTGEKNNVHDYMQAFDVLLFPSIYEALGIVLIEAQASGLPCISTINISKEAEVSGKFYRYSLNDSPKVWAEATLSAANNNEREMSKECFSYDIVECSKELERIYTDLNRIKICHFVYGIVNGGVERVLLNYFYNMNLENYDLHIVTQGKCDKKCLQEFENLGFTIHNVTKKSESLLKNYIEITQILKKYKFDIVHSHMSNTNFFPLLYSKLAHIKVRINHSHNAHSKMNLKIKLLCFLAKILDTNRMACSEDAAVWLFNTKKNVKILNNAIDLTKFQYNQEIRKKIRNEMNLENKIVIGHIGRFAEQKNHKFLIDVFEKLYQENKNYELLLIGIGELEDSIKSYVKTLKSKNSIKFLETRDDVSDLYQAMDIFVLPSLYEGLGIVLVEAQTSGLKCLGSIFIPQEVKITENIKFLELDLPKWIKAIQDTNYNNRRSKIDEATEKGFNIKVEAEKLDKYYKSLI